MKDKITQEWIDVLENLFEPNYYRDCRWNKNSNYWFAHISLNDRAYLDPQTTYLDMMMHWRNKNGRN